MKKITTKHILSMKNREKIVMITAYDALFARLFDEYVDMILIGDSLNMSFNGKDDTVDISLEAMLYHTKAVVNGTKKALIVMDMPFGSVIDEKTALINSIRGYKESGADAVKIEGGIEKVPIIKTLCQNGIAVVGHIGLKPQMVRFEGGYSVKKDTQKLINDAKALEEAGVFAIVLEATNSSVAKEVATSVNVPIIGIGSGVNVDGQVLVWSDMLGIFDKFKPKFVKRYLDGANLIKTAVKEYANEVKESKFPSKEYEYNN